MPDYRAIRDAIDEAASSLVTAIQQCEEDDPTLDTSALAESLEVALEHTFVPEWMTKKIELIERLERQGRRRG